MDNNLSQGLEMIKYNVVDLIFDELFLCFIPSFVLFDPAIFFLEAGSPLVVCLYLTSGWILPHSLSCFSMWLCPYAFSPSSPVHSEAMPDACVRTQELAVSCCCCSSAHTNHLPVWWKNQTRKTKHANLTCFSIPVENMTWLYVKCIICLMKNEVLLKNNILFWMNE